MSTCSFTFQTETDTDISYCATGVMYVPLNTMVSVFQFETTEISNNTLSSTIFDNSAADITYHVNSSSYPIINGAHSSMDNSLSQGRILDISYANYNNVKFDYIFYLLDTINISPLDSNNNINWSKIWYFFMGNHSKVRNDIEIMFWNVKTDFETILSNADNSGNGLTNSNTTNNNITRVLLKQLAHFDSDRLTTTNSNSITNTTNKQNFPFIEGDTISNFVNIVLTDDDDVPDRKYRILLYLTNNSSNVNPSPVYSLADSNHGTVTDRGVPVIS
jgi:hypothetical protein